VKPPSKKGSNNTKAKPRPAVVKTSPSEQEQTIAELRQELEARNRDLAATLQREKAALKKLQDRDQQLAEALEQQTATGEVLGVIASSPTQLQPVLDTVITNAVKLIGADFGHIRRYDGEFLQHIMPRCQTCLTCVISILPPLESIEHDFVA
jgi:hypothetical protein